MRNKQRRGRSAARADNKFPNIIFSFVPVFSPRIIALLTFSPPLPPHLFLFPYFSFFFSANEQTVSRALAIRKPSRNCISWDFLRTISQIVSQLPLVAEPTYKFHDAYYAVTSSLIFPHSPCSNMVVRFYFYPLGSFFRL